MISFLVYIAAQVALVSWVSATLRKPIRRARHNDISGTDKQLVWLRAKKWHKRTQN
jgi:hypothetical protein